MQGCVTAAGRSRGRSSVDQELIPGRPASREDRVAVADCQQLFELRWSEFESSQVFQEKRCDSQLKIAPSAMALATLRTFIAASLWFSNLHRPTVVTAARAEIVAGELRARLIAHALGRVQHA